MVAVCVMWALKIALDALEYLSFILSTSIGVMVRDSTLVIAWTVKNLLAITEGLDWYSISLADLVVELKS